MRKAARVFLILGMIFQCYLIFPIILGIFANKCLSNAKTRDDLKTWGILSIFFVSTLGGIFMLCIRDEELTNNCAFNKISTEDLSDNLTESAEKLLQLKQLYDENIIDLETYQEKRKKYLEDL